MREKKFNCLNFTLRLFLGQCLIHFEEKRTKPTKFLFHSSSATLKRMSFSTVHLT